MNRSGPQRFSANQGNKKTAASIYQQQQMVMMQGTGQISSKV